MVQRLSIAQIRCALRLSRIITRNKLLLGKNFFIAASLEFIKLKSTGGCAVRGRRKQTCGEVPASILGRLLSPPRQKARLGVAPELVVAWTAAA